MNNQDHRQDSAREASCRNKGSYVGRFLLFALASFITLFISETLFVAGLTMLHYYGIHPLREEEGLMIAYIRLNLARQLGTALVFASSFQWLHYRQSDCGSASAVKFGIVLGFAIGLLVGFAHLSGYSWAPAPEAGIPIVQFVGNTAIGTLMGGVLGWVRASPTIGWRIP